MSLVASDTSIEDALEPVKLFECIGERGCDVGSRFAVQTLNLIWLWGLFRPAASRPATASPRSRTSLMITFGFASTR